MPRKKIRFGPKRHSTKLGPIRVNRKGIIPTSSSIGFGGTRINVGPKGTRMTTKLPGTQYRVTQSLGAKKVKYQEPVVHTIEEKKKRGCLPGCSPKLIIAIIAIVVVVALVV